MILVIDHHHWGAAAGSETLFFTLQMDTVVSGTFTQFYTQLFLHMIYDLVCAAQHAGNIGADCDVVTPDGLRLKHGMERADFIDLNSRQVQVFGDRIH